VAGREGERGECETRLGSVWRETGAIRNARPSRGQAAPTRKTRSGTKARSHLCLRLEEFSEWLERSVGLDVSRFRSSAGREPGYLAL